MTRVCVIGAGASGCTAAIFAARNGAEVILLEANSSPAEKILKTGNGRCNFTNLNLNGRVYNNAFADFVISRFTAYDAINFFEGLGVKPICSGTYVYPRNNEAKTIRDALLAELLRLGVKLHNNINVCAVNRTGEGFDILTGGYTYKADKIIFACGGLVGGDGKAYRLAQRLGHNKSQTVPALTALIAQSPLTAARGVRCYAALRLLIDGDAVCGESGELQLTDFGVSGIPVFQLSGRAALALAEGRQVKLAVDFAPEMSEEELASHSERFGFSGILPAKLSAVLAGENLCACGIKNYELTVTGARGYDFAQITAGGIITDDINPETFESKLVSGVYFCGEMLDIDGRCGGYNLHFAWASGAVAGTAAAGETYTGIDSGRSAEIKARLSECVKS